MALYEDNGKENGNYRDYRGCCLGAILYSVSLSVFGSQWRQLIH